MLEGLDQEGNRDGKIQRVELPAHLQRFFESGDLDGDGVLTWQEADEAKAKRFADLPSRKDRSTDRHMTPLPHHPMAMLVAAIDSAPARAAPGAEFGYNVNQGAVP